MTDMYHPDSAYVSWVAGRNGLTTFDLFTRSAPFGGAYLLVAGLEAALEFVQDFHYSSDELDFLARIRDYDTAFLDELARLRFTGEIVAMPEGSIAFPNEPLLRVTAPFREAILIESGLLQALNLSTLLATKASRVVWAAQQRRVSEFGFRRAQNPLVASRSAAIGGASSTSLLLAAFEYRLLATGTVPHALVQLFATEDQAFEYVARAFNRYTLLLDTYDPRRAIHIAIEVARRVQEDMGHVLVAVRLDSGDLVADSQYVREALRASAMGNVRILGSGDLDEYMIADLLARGAELDAFGVGTALGVGLGSVAHGSLGSALGGVYKVAWYVEEDGDEQPKLKLAQEKTTWPGRKEVYRQPQWQEDVVQLVGEPAPAGYTRLLRPVMRSGHVVPGSLPPLSEIRELAQANLAALPEPYRALDTPQPYPVRFSDALQALRDETAQRAGDLGDSSGR
jgi:nicotinate phosphoribosyltransferase